MATNEAVPHNCPGPSSQEAGKADACAGCPSQSTCQSAPKGPDPDIALIAKRLAQVRKIILVLSGKGGVGKSTFTTQLAFALSGVEREREREGGEGEEREEEEEKEVGLLDVDICGPSVPKMMGLEGEQVHSSNEGWSPLYVRDNLAVMSIGFLLSHPDKAVIWRGPKKNGLIKQFLRDVDWGKLDYLVVDTPPGTSDEHISIVQYLAGSLAANNASNQSFGAVILTTPQEVALADVRKEIGFCRKVGLPIIGVVENMSGFVCPKCKTETQIFAATTGGAEKMCSDLNLPFLGKIPIDPSLARACDEGESYIERCPDSQGARAFESVFKQIRSIVDK